MFEQTEPMAEETLTPDFWTNGTVEIGLSTDDNLSGVRDITLPDGSVVDAAQAKYTVCLLYTSGHYNPFAYLRRDSDALRLVTNLVANTTPKGAKNSDPFWGATRS